MSLQEKIIKELGVKPTIDAQEEIRKSVDFLKDYLKKYPFIKTYVLGISGGQDSTLAGRLAQIAMEEMASTIFGQRVLITGHGRISKVLMKILNGMGAEVTVTARKYSDLAWAEIYGCHGIHTSSLKDCIRNFSLIINTVPAVILNEDILKEASAESLIIDLASKPGGVDFDTARRLGLKVVWALSLPGKVAPVSSGEIIASTILNILKERRYTDG